MRGGRRSSWRRKRRVCVREDWRGDGLAVIDIISLSRSDFKAKDIVFLL